MSILMALVFLLAGIICIRRPERLAQWMRDAIKRTGNPMDTGWLQGPGLLFFIRVLGFLALINAVMLFYIAGRS